MKPPSSERLAPANIGVKKIPTISLAPNPHNPRMLFDREPLDILKASIKKVDILVPLTVYWGKSLGRYIILDGQRRWICAQELGMKEVPVNEVEEPNLVQNIVTMFQIHRLRQDWELMPTALKLEVLMEELKETNDKKLAELTRLDQAVVVRCKKLLSYPKKYQDLMLDADPTKRVRADFFIELYAVRNDRTVNKMAWFNRDKFTQEMLEKYQNKLGGFKAVTDFRPMKQHITNAVRAKKFSVISKRLEEFTKDNSLTLDHLVIKSADVSMNARKLLANIKRLVADIDAVDVEQFYGEEELWRNLESLLTLIRSKLKAAGRRLDK